MVDPLVAVCCKQGFKRVGIIATHATVQSGVYERQLHKCGKEIKVQALATPLLAPMIEEGFVHNNISHSVIETYLSDPVLEGIETLLLACTHYPLIRGEIIQYYKNRIPVLDSTEVTAHALKEALETHGLLNEKKTQQDRFFVSDFSESFLKTTRLFYPEDISLELNNIWI